MKVLYVGGFEMPDGNAAAQRVLAIAKSLGPNYEIRFLGLTHTDNFKGVVDGFEYVNLPYPKSKKEWVEHLSGSRELRRMKSNMPDIIIAYNYPALGLWRLLRICKNMGIKLIGDVTEWYHAHNVLKWLDTQWRMKRIHKKLDGLIVISKYLSDYYIAKKQIRIPPTLDLASPLWSNNQNSSFGEPLSLLYVGSPGRGDKDRLDRIVDVIKPFSRLSLKIVGITVEDFCIIYKRNDVPKNVVFLGRLSHEMAAKELIRADFSIFFRDPIRQNNAGFPTKYAEAAAAGVPVISNHFSDLGELIINGENGFIAENNMASVLSILKQVADLPLEDVERMKRYCRKHNEMFDYRYYSSALNLFMNTICDN